MKSNGNTIKRNSTRLVIRINKNTSHHKSGDIRTLTKNERGYWSDGEYCYFIAHLRTPEFCTILEQSDKLIYNCEIVKDFDGSYYANLFINGQFCCGLPEYVDYKTLKQAIALKGVQLPNISELRFERYGRKSYAHFNSEIPNSRITA